MYDRRLTVVKSMLIKVKMKQSREPCLYLCNVTWEEYDDWFIKKCSYETANGV